VDELGQYLREQRRAAGLSVRQLGRLAGVSNPYLSQIERGLRRPSAEILHHIAKALHIRSEALYVRAGILEERTIEVDVADAVRHDDTIDDSQKQTLIDLYTSMRTESMRTESMRAEKTSTENGASANH
jgi:transcriptional regulator with XRE-family HTH domain